MMTVGVPWAWNPNDLQKALLRFQAMGALPTIRVRGVRRMPMIVLDPETHRALMRPSIGRAGW